MGDEQNKQINNQDDVMEILSKLKDIVIKIRSSEDGRNETMGQLKKNHYDRFDGNSNQDQVMRVFAAAVNYQLENELDIGDNVEKVKQSLKRLLELDDEERIDDFFEVDDWKTFFASLSSPLDMAKCLKNGAPQQLIKDLIENQFKIKWKTTTGEPSNYTYHQFCDHANTTALLTYKPRQAHVKATLYKECGEKNINELKSITKEELCPPVYIRTTSGWKKWKAEDDTFENANFEEELNWMNDSIKEFIGENADEQKDDDEHLKILKKPTLYWAVLEDGDFILGDKLKLKEIGKTQVYVGQAVNGIKGRWNKDGSNHCEKMKRCLDNACAMTTYDPLRMEGIPLVDARLTLAKVRGEKTALFLIKSFGDNVEKAEMAKQEVQASYEKAKSNSEEAEQEYKKTCAEYQQARSDGNKRRQVKRKEAMDEAEQIYSESSKKLEKNKNKLNEAKEDVKKAIEEEKKDNEVKKKCLKDNLREAEEKHLEGKRIGHKNSNIIPYNKYKMTWVPTNMGYGMNKC